MTVDTRVHSVHLMNAKQTSQLTWTVNPLTVCYNSQSVRTKTQSPVFDK